LHFANGEWVKRESTTRDKPWKRKGEATNTCAWCIGGTKRKLYGSSEARGEGWSKKPEFQNVGAFLSKGPGRPVTWKKAKTNAGKVKQKPCGMQKGNRKRAKKITIGPRFGGRKSPVKKKSRTRHVDTLPKRDLKQGTAQLPGVKRRN